MYIVSIYIMHIRASDTEKKTSMFLNKVLNITLRCLNCYVDRSHFN